MSDAGRCSVQRGLLVAGFIGKDTIVSDQLPICRSIYTTLAKDLVFVVRQVGHFGTVGYVSCGPLGVLIVIALRPACSNRVADLSGGCSKSKGAFEIHGLKTPFAAEAHDRLGYTRRFSKTTVARI